MTNPVFIAPLFPLMYRAVGQVHGRFIPTLKKVTKGVLLTDDGLSIPARLVGRAGLFGKISPDTIRGDLVWSAYPHTEVALWFDKSKAFLPNDEALEAVKNQPLPALWLELRDIRQPKKDQSIEEIRQGNNYFSIRGQIIKQDEKEGKLIVRICRNKIPKGKEKDIQNQPFNLMIDGFLPGNVEGQFWDFDVSREGEILIIENGTFVADLSEPKAEVPPSSADPKQKEEEKNKQTDASGTKTQPKKTGKIIRLVK
ncbi:hypothetical protein ACE1CD_04285 [Aerosakkonema sp. BLCC-F183]|uniref:hypothetical protein n=1 Tax=Aerosakkonema sp. BLCC-F183 TaxID=3342834 RepID=UPI0035B79987